MTYVKISELPTMQELSNTDLLPIVDVSETETKKITKQNLLTDIDAGQVKIGQLTEATQINDEDYLIITQNGINKKISKANAKFASGDEVYVGDTEPTGEDDDSVKLWIEPSEDSVDAEGTYISNEYGIAQDKGYSQEYANEHFGGVVLYDNSNGTNQNITLNNDTFENYSKIEILTKHWYFDEWQTYVLVEPNNKNHNLDMNYIRNDGVMYITSTTININDATLSYTFSGAVNTTTSFPVGANQIPNDPNVRQKIYKIIGYK